MRDMEETIINIFRSNPSRELSTEQITKQSYPREFSLAQDLLSSQDKQSMNSGKDKKFQLHRKTLYYLNKLVENNIIKVSRIAEKGEKHFTLLASEGDTIFEKGYKKIVITKPVISANYIEQYESRKLMKKYEENSWINRLASMLIECNNQEISRLYNIIIDCFTNVNDVIGLNEFEKVINASNEKATSDFIDRLAVESYNYSKNISIIINLSESNSNILKFIDEYTKINPKNINIIFNISSRDLQKSSKYIYAIFEKFSEKKIKINIKNNDITKTPCFKGRAGIYTFSDNEWNVYLQKFKGKTIGISCAQSQVAINVSKFFEEHHTDAEFRKAVMNCAKTLLLANNIQRRKGSEYFRNINNLNHESPELFYKLHRNYIRFWNYDWSSGMKGKEDTFPELVKSVKELVDNFCHNEETIFKSSGIPIRFRIAFSSAFKNYDSEFMGERDYKKATVNKIEDYYSGDIKTFLQYREKMLEIFDGGDRVRIFRNINFNQNDILNELGILLNAYRFPLFTYDFSGRKGAVKLTSFIE